MGRTVALITLAMLAGCATCEKHEFACAVVVGVAAGCIAASDSHRTQPHDVSIQTPNCASGACR